MPSPLTFYHYPKCSTCRNARNWLKDHGIEVEAVDIVENPPSAQHLELVLQRSGLEIRRLFNTSGQSYRQGSFKERMPDLTESEALQELSKDGKLIKRPLLLGENLALVGFKADAYTEALNRAEG